MANLYGMGQSRRPLAMPKIPGMAMPPVPSSMRKPRAVGQFSVPPESLAGDVAQPPRPGGMLPLPSRSTAPYAPPSLPPTQMPTSPIPHMPSGPGQFVHPPVGPTYGGNNFRPAQAPDPNLPPAPSGSVPPLTHVHQSGGQFDTLPGTAGGRIRNLPTPGTGVLLGKTGIRAPSIPGEGEGVLSTAPQFAPSLPYVPSLASRQHPNSANFELGMAKVQGQAAARQALSARNLKTYASMGSPDHTSVDQLLAARRNQNQQFGSQPLSASDQKQLALGGARPVPEDPRPLPPKLDQSSRFYHAEGAMRTPDGGAHVMTPSGGAALIGSKPMAELHKQGISLGELQQGIANPRSPAAYAMRDIQRASESDLARKRNEAGGGGKQSEGGGSIAAQYAQQQIDDRILNQARLQRVGDASPAVSRAHAREMYRQEDLRNTLSGVGGGGSGGGTRGGLQAMGAAVSRVQKTPVGPALGKAKSATDVIDTLKIAKSHASPSEWRDLQAWATHHQMTNPDLWKSPSYQIELDKLFAPTTGAMASVPTTTPALTPYTPPSPWPTVPPNSTWRPPTRTP